MFQVIGSSINVSLPVTSDTTEERLDVVDGVLALVIVVDTHTYVYSAITHK